MARDPASSAIEIHGLTKTFGGTRALCGLDLVADSSRVLALLGPNGAGKTTLVRILATLLRPDSGWARVAGVDVARQPAELRSVIGLTGQFAAIDPLLTGAENLEMVGALCHLERTVVNKRALELLDRFDLADAADRLAKTYSGGMLRRLDLAASLVARPPVLILDEPTTGLDPRTRAQVWETVSQLAADGTTVLLTTQYLEEADRLAHRIAVIDRGEIVAEGTSRELKAGLGADVVEVQFTKPETLELGANSLSGTVGLHIDRHGRRITVPAPDGVDTLRTILDRLQRDGAVVEDIGIRRPSLDDVFLALTGHGVDVDDASSEPSPPEFLSRRPVAGTGERKSAAKSDAAAHRPRSDRPSLRADRWASPISALRDAWVVTKRNLRRIRRTPRLLLVSSIQPVLFVLTFQYVFGGSIRISGESYIDYLLPGTLVTATLLGATTAVAMASDLSSGLIDRFRSLPMARSAVLAGRCLADAIRSVLVVAIVLFVGLILGFRFHSGVLGALGALGFVIAGGLAFTSLYALIGLLARDPETAQMAGFLSIMPFVFGSSVFVRVQNMPGWLQEFSRHQPVTVIVDTVRALCDGGPVGHLAWQAAAWTAAVIAACGYTAVRVYRRV